MSEFNLQEQDIIKGTLEIHDHTDADNLYLSNCLKEINSDLLKDLVKKFGFNKYSQKNDSDNFKNVLWSNVMWRR